MIKLIIILCWVGKFQFYIFMQVKRYFNIETITWQARVSCSAYPPPSWGGRQDNSRPSPSASVAGSGRRCNAMRGNRAQ